MKSLLSIAFCFFSAALPAEAGWQHLQGSGLEYWLYSPAGKANAGARALMLTLHGCDQHARDLKELGNWESAAEKYGMIVAVPEVPNGGVMLGCWDYYGRDHTESNHHNGALLALTQALIANPDLHIDPAKVFASGISSGATQAMLLGCLRPDLFAGLGLAAGAALGSELSEVSRPRTTVNQAAQYCRKLAGIRGDALARQRASLIRGDEDFVVDTRHTDINAGALARVYGATQTRNFGLQNLVGSHLAGSGSLWLDGQNAPRISVIVNEGLDHSWPAGKPQGGSADRYVNPASLCYPDYLGDFLINALR